MSVKRKIEDYKLVLVVEGYSDLAFYAEFLEHIGRHPGVFIEDVEGKGNMRRALKALITPELLREKTHIGVIVDADQNAQGAFESIRNTLLQLTGAAVASHATWSTAPNYGCQVGVFIAPNGTDSGEVETLVWDAWSGANENLRATACIEQYLTCMAGLQRLPQSLDKARLGSLLAILNDEDARLGPGAQRRIFDFNNPKFDSLREFLSEYPQSQGR